MIKVENVGFWGFEHAIRGMRNPMNSWDKSDSVFWNKNNIYLFVPVIGPNDLDLMKRLFKAGSEHRKYLRQIFASMDITAPLYWWKEFDTYKVGTTANSCSTMHKIHAKEFALEDFSHEHLLMLSDIPKDAIISDMTEDPAKPKLILKNGACGVICGHDPSVYAPISILGMSIKMLNRARELYLETKEKKYWWQMIQLLPSSYNQKRTITMNYENVVTMIHQRTGHKLDEWNEFVKQLKKLPYVEEIME